jgi:DNA-binding IclR family transcriptional regulator
MNNYVIPNLVKACEIMKILVDRPKGILAVEAENLTRIPRTTAFRILKTLCSQGMAEKRGTLFFAGPELIQIGLNSLRSLEIRSLAIPFLSELATKTHFTAHLAIPSGWQSLILEVHDSPNPVRVASRSGTTVPLHCSSTGKIFLSYRYEQELEDYFSATLPEKKTANTIVTLSEMQKEIERIKSDGFAVDNHEFHEDVWCLAAPVRDSGGQVVAAIGVTGPAAQSDSQKKADICMYVKKAAVELSAKLGYIALSN